MCATDLLLLHLMKNLPSVVNFTRSELREHVMNYLDSRGVSLKDNPDILEDLVDITEMYLQLKSSI